MTSNDEKRLIRKSYDFNDLLNDCVTDQPTNKQNQNIVVCTRLKTGLTEQVADSWAGVVLE